jgi:phosphatidylserine decarboxylase
MIWIRLQHLLPQRLIGRAVYHLARCQWRWVKGPLIRWFARRFDVNLAEAERSDPDDYRSFNDFFTRALAAGARPIAGGEETVISPADGRLTGFGTLVAGQLLQAKGMSYALTHLLGAEPTALGPLSDGSYATIYLAPRDYHRVHMPIAGALTRTEYFPGRRFSVNAATTALIRNLFCRNERVVCWFRGAHGPFAIVLVGALNVSSISTATLGEIASGARRSWPDAGRAFRRGEELARFSLGSTVIMLFPSGSVRWQDRLEPGTRVELGRAIGTLHSAAGAGELSQAAAPGHGQQP